MNSYSPSNTIYKTRVCKCCAFTGHRPAKLPWGYDETDASCMEFKFRLRESLEYLIGRGYADFLSGGALGFDMMAAEIVLSLREKYPWIQLTMVLPFDGQADKWTAEQRQRWLEALKTSFSNARQLYIDLQQFHQQSKELEAEVSHTQSGISNLRGIFNGKRRRELEVKLETITKKLHAQKEQEKQKEEQYNHALIGIPDEIKESGNLDENELIYICAGMYYNAHLYDSALIEYSKIKNYKDVDAILRCQNMKEALRSWQDNFVTGNTVVLGHYKQGVDVSSNEEGIEWIVLESNGDTAKLISKYGLAVQPYHEECIDITVEIR